MFSAHRSFTVLSGEMNGIQGGSDKSGILKIFLEIHTAELKTIRFYWSKKIRAEGHIENQFMQWNGCQWRLQPQS
jgi:hypothetical protein